MPSLAKCSSGREICPRSLNVGHESVGNVVDYDNAKTKMEELEATAVTLMISSVDTSPACQAKVDAKGSALIHLHRPTTATSPFPSVSSPSVNESQTSPDSGLGVEETYDSTIDKRYRLSHFMPHPLCFLREGSGTNQRKSNC